jgi:DNA-binding response OmpR family regulator
LQLLIVEDNARLAELLAAGLRRAGWSSDHAGLLAEARTACASNRYQAILLDRRLPDGDGVQLIRQLRAGATPDLPMPIVMLMTARGTLPERIEGLNLGADDYLVKPVAIEELIARLNAAMRRMAPPPRSLLRCGRISYESNSRGVSIDGAPFEMPRRESSILERLLQAMPQPVAKAVLEVELDSFDRGIGGNAIEVYVHRLRRRMEEASAGAVIETVRGLGYRLVPEEKPTAPEF